MKSRDKKSVTPQRFRWPFHGYLGIGLISIFWPVNWFFPGFRSLWAFFPLWLGYCFTIDALVFLRKGSSLFTRSKIGYFRMFLISAPVWWLFELINLRTQNWVYIGKELITNFEHGLFATFSFSTVVPSVFGTAELVSTFNWIKKLKPGKKISNSPVTASVFCITGSALLAGILIWPDYFFPFVWLSVYLIVEPFNYILKNRTLLLSTTVGDWRPVMALFVGSLICGFFWEMWNYFSYPKWVYHIPFVDFLRIFEMPILGYMGYLPFSLELFALYHLVVGILRHKERGDYIQITVS